MSDQSKEAGYEQVAFILKAQPPKYFSPEYFCLTKAISEE
jgi:hypothetical protein